MPDRTELRLLSRWCATHGLTWRPVRVDAMGTSLLLTPRAPRDPWGRMELTADGSLYRLADEAGTPIAAATDLPALLDALEAGVADAPDYLGANGLFHPGLPPAGALGGNALAR